MIETLFTDIVFVWLDIFVWTPLCHSSLMLLMLTVLLYDTSVGISNGIFFYLSLLYFGLVFAFNSVTSNGGDAVFVVLLTRVLLM